MLFNSLDYLFFFPIVFLLYFLIPGRYRYVWLLVASYYFYMCWSARYALLMLFSTLSTYLGGLAVQFFRDRKRAGLSKLSVGLVFAVNLLILGFFKYANFFIENVNTLVGALGLSGQLRHVSLLLPVSISFYTFQALSYVMDIYRGDTPCERNVLKYMLFVSFFPQLVAGPIERTGNLLTQIHEPKPFRVENARRGLLIMAWGLFMKLVLADNLARVVNPVYDGFAQYAGIEIVLATFLFAFQIYCDFAGYSYIAVGSAEILGFRLTENFRCPYLAVSISDFWRRWHITLTTWFKDYLYIPLGGNRKGRARKYVNSMIVFLVSGLWHGANWTFVIWGAMNGAMIVLGEATKGVRMRAVKALRLNTEAFSYTLYRRTLTFLLICVTWVFFRAPDIGTALRMLGRVATDLQLHRLFSPAIFDMGLNVQLIVVALSSIALLMAVDVAQNRGRDVGAWILSQGAGLRWSVYLSLLLAIILFGVYGSAAYQTQFIYFQF